MITLGQREGFFPPILGGEKFSTINRKKIANDVLIFVLIANTVASVGETFVMALREMENVVFVGFNTSGGCNVGNYCFFTLPNSGVFSNWGLPYFFHRPFL